MRHKTSIAYFYILLMTGGFGVGERSMVELLIAETFRVIDRFLEKKAPIGACK